MAEKLSDTNFEKLAEFIYRKAGIYLEVSKHYAKIDNLVSKRITDGDFADFRKYFFKLRFEDHDGEEFQALMNGVTVNETYFFREETQLDALSTVLIPKLHQIRPKREPLRILSAPSSTGEEPYSMIIKILEEENVIGERDIEVVGIDIDSTVIDKAKAGKYSDRSIHAIPQTLVSKYFKKSGMWNQFSPDLCGAVEFRVVNIFDKVQVRQLGKFDVIFSRNMLIYFDDASRKEVAMTFYDLLKPDGYVLLGHAEYMSRIVSVFKAQKVLDTLVYQK